MNEQATEDTINEQALDYRGPVELDANDHADLNVETGPEDTAASKSATLARLRAAADDARAEARRWRQAFEREPTPEGVLSREVTEQLARNAEQAVAVFASDIEPSPALCTPRVQVNGSRADLLRERQQIVQRRDYRHSQHQQAVERESATCDYRHVEEHLKAHLRNIFAPGEQMRRLDDERDQRQIDHIDAQIAELDRREARGAA